MPKKRLLLFFSLIIVSFILMTYQINRKIPNPLHLINYPVNIANDAINSIWLKIKGSFRKIQLRDEENKKLKLELDNLLMERHKYKEAILENARLEELLALKEKEKKYVTAARVISRGNDQWTNTLVINKGRHDRVEKDMTVITGKGLVGKVFSASNSYAYVLLLTDVNFSAAIRLQESRTEGIISGTGSKTCMLKYVSHEYEVKENEMALTSGLDSLFPPGIPVGAVTRIAKKGAGIFQNIEVTPFQDSAKLEEVVIIRR